MAHPLQSNRGSSLLESVIAAGLLVTALAAALPLAVSTAAAVLHARADLLARHLARQRLSQLLVLTHVRAPTGIVADQQSRLDDAEPFRVGGAGLIPTGPAPLQVTAEPTVDWLDAHGSWLAGGSQTPPAAHFRRRWAVLAAGIEGCQRVWVEVAPLGPSVGDHTAHADGVHCPWGVGQP